MTNIYILQYLKYCDEILVMRDGAVVEKGTHDFILSNGKEYANLLSLYVKHEEAGERKTEKKKLQNGDTVKTPGKGYNFFPVKYYVFIPNFIIYLVKYCRF